MLEIKKLSYGYNKDENKNLIKNLSFSVDKGHIKLVFGKSGIGKSTLLDIISGIINRDLIWTGKIFLDGLNVSQETIETRRIGYIMQDRLLFPHFTVYENLYFAMPKSERFKKNVILSYLEKISLLEIKNLYPSEISGGQSTRITCLSFTT